MNVANAPSGRLMHRSKMIFASLSLAMMTAWCGCNDCLLSLLGLDERDDAGANLLRLGLDRGQECAQ